MKNAIIKNEFNAPFGASDKLEKKYIRYLQDMGANSIHQSVFESLKSRDIDRIEESMLSIANSMRSNILLFGLSCVVIDRENIYRKAGFNSYLEYADHLFEKMDIARQTLSDAKIIMSTYIDHYKGLSKHGFQLNKNAHKLRFLESALENHTNEDEVYSRAANSTLREFKDWASSGVKKLPSPEPRIAIKIDGNKIMIDGKNMLNIPSSVPAKVKESIASDLAATFRIRATGNEPFIIETYGRGEQRAIENFIKKFRGKK
jgi:hypothetical protein